MKILVRNNTVGYLHLGIPVKVGPKNPPSPYSAPRIPLLPGANEIDCDLWKKVVKSVKSELEAGIIETIGTPYKEGVNVLTKLTPRRAVELVEETVCGKLLLDWREKEKRKLVVQALDAQLKRLELTAREKKTDVKTTWHEKLARSPTVPVFIDDSKQLADEPEVIE